MAVTVHEMKTTESSSEEEEKTNTATSATIIAQTTGMISSTEIQRQAKRRRLTLILETMISVNLKSQSKLKKINMKAIAIGKIMGEPRIIIKIRGIIEIIIGT